MSLIAEFKILPIAKLEKQLLLGHTGLTNTDWTVFLTHHARSLSDGDLSGYVYATLLEYLAEVDIELEEGAYQEWADKMSEEICSFCFVLTNAHRNKYLNRLAPANFNEEELGAYFNDFNDEEEEEAGAWMLSGIRVLHTHLREVSETSVLLLMLS